MLWIPDSLYQGRGGVVGGQRGAPWLVLTQVAWDLESGIKFEAL